MNQPLNTLGLDSVSVWLLGQPLAGNFKLHVLCFTINEKYLFGALNCTLYTQL